jgi:hypothetical protein
LLGITIDDCWDSMLISPVTYPEWNNIYNIYYSLILEVKSYYAKSIVSLISKSIGTFIVKDSILSKNFFFKLQEKNFLRIESDPEEVQ